MMQHHVYHWLLRGRRFQFANLCFVYLFDQFFCILIELSLSQPSHPSVLNETLGDCWRVVNQISVTHKDAVSKSVNIHWTFDSWPGWPTIWSAVTHGAYVLSWNKSAIHSDWFLSKNRQISAVYLIFNGYFANDVAWWIISKQIWPPAKSFRIISELFHF